MVGEIFFFRENGFTHFWEFRSQLWACQGGSLSHKLQSRYIFDRPLLMEQQSIRWSTGGDVARVFLALQFFWGSCFFEVFETIENCCIRNVSLKNSKPTKIEELR